MHPTNIPLVLSSLTFLFPFFAAVETQNVWTAVPWGALAITSTLVHLTKCPYHIYGPGNCIPWLYTLDVGVLYIATLRAVYDSWIAGSVAPFLATIAVLYANVMFYVGQYTKRFVYDTHLDMSILSHVTVHLLASFGTTATIYIRAFKNGQSIS